MLLNRLVAAAELLKNEFERLELDTLITSSANLAANRPNIPQSSYLAEARKIRERAVQVLSSNRVALLPEDLLTKIESGRLSSVVPARIARMIIAAIPISDPASAASSPEINLYLTQARQIISEIEGFLLFSHAFGFESYNPEPQNVIVEFSLPRSAFKNEIGPLGVRIKSFDDLLKPIAELITGERIEPKLLYISTSDPLFVLEWAPYAALGLFAYYKQLLLIAENFAAVIKSVRVLTGSGAELETIAGIEAQLSGSIDKKIRAAAENLIKEKSSHIEAGRANELVNEIEIHSKIFVKDITRGARVTITIDPAIAGPTATNDEGLAERIKHINETVSEVGKLGARIKEIVGDFQGPLDQLEGPDSSSTSFDV